MKDAVQPYDSRPECSANILSRRLTVRGISVFYMPIMALPTFAAERLCVEGPSHALDAGGFSKLTKLLDHPIIYRIIYYRLYHRQVRSTE